MKAYKVFKRRNGILTNSLFHPEFSQEIIPGEWNRPMLGKFFIFTDLFTAKKWILDNQLGEIELWEIEVPEDQEIDWEPIDPKKFNEFWNGENENDLFIMKRPSFGTFLAYTFKPTLRYS